MRSESDSESTELECRKEFGVHGGVSVPETGPPPKTKGTVSRAIGVGAREVVGVGRGAMDGATGVKMPATR